MAERDEDRQMDEMLAPAPPRLGEGYAAASPEKEDRLGDTVLTYVRPAFDRAVERLRDAGVADVDPEDPRLVQAMQRAGDYFGDMAMAGLDLGEAAGGAVAGALGEVFGGSPAAGERAAYPDRGDFSNVRKSGRTSVQYCPGRSYA